MAKKVVCFIYNRLIQDFTIILELGSFIVVSHQYQQLNYRDTCISISLVYLMAHILGFH